MAHDARVPSSKGIALALLTGLWILLWRLAGNTQVLKDDPIPLVSPNDVLCPVVRYVLPRRPRRWPWSCR